MPALEACCRKWEFASDDLVFPFFGALLFRILCFAGILVAVAYFSESYSCSESRVLIGFTFSVLAIIIVAIVVDFLIMFFSARGTIVRPRARRPVKHLLHLRLLVFMLEILLLIVGTVIAFKPDIGINSNAYNNSTAIYCPKIEQAITLIRIISGVDWCVLLVIALVALIYLDPLHFYSTRADNKFRIVRTAEGPETERHWMRVQTTWEKRFKVACCITGRDDEHQVAYQEVAQLFANFFGDLNVVPSDIAAGLALLQKKHLVAIENGTEEQHPLSVPLDLQSGQDSEAYRRSLHYLKYALAVYTWSLHIYMNLKCGLCSLCQHLSCCSPQRDGVVGDNCCGCNIAGVRQVGQLDDDDIVYASFTNDIYQSPFLVLLDHEYRSVVISIRGTLSMGDVITDLVANPEPIQLPEPRAYSVHKGMLRTAEQIRDQLKEGHILDRAFSRGAGYNLVIVGHSLGAGCAAILGLLLREPDYPDLRCYCYSPPGTVIDEQGAAFTEEFVTSTTLGHDLVSHSSIHTFTSLKEDLARAIEQSRKPKYRIFLEGGLETSCWCIGRQVVFKDNDETYSIIKEEEADYGTDKGFVPVISKHLGSAKTEHLKEVLFVPGKIIHLADTDVSRGCCSSRRTLKPHWAHRSRFKKIEVTPGMIRDHFPDVISAAMNTVWVERGGVEYHPLIPGTENATPEISI